MKRDVKNRRYFEAEAFPHLKALYRTALCVSDSESDAQDLVQETFAKAYRSWHKYQFNPNCRVWLFRIMANALVNKYRPSLKLPARMSDTDEIDRNSLHSWPMDQQPIADYDQVPFSASSEDDFKKAIRNLPNDFRLIVVLSLLEGFSYQEIAEIAGINLETVRSGLCQGRKLVQRELCDHVACEGNYSMTADRVRSRRTG